MIKNLVNGKVYVGQSKNSNGINYRLAYHKSKLRKGVHPNKHLQASYNKYGEHNFSFSIIEECDISQLNEREIYWIQFYNSLNPKYGFNKTTGGEADRKYTNESKEKMRNARKSLIENGKMVGDNHPMSKVTINDVEKIKILLSKGVSVGEVSSSTGVNLGIVKEIKALNAWFYVREDLNELIRSYVKTPNQAISEDKVKEIKVLLSEGKSLEEVSEITGVSKFVIFDIKRLKTFKNIYAHLNEKISSYRYNKKSLYDKNKIIYMHKSGMRNKEIAKIIGCDPSLVSKIVSNYKKGVSVCH